jgi:hypothetical protein
MNHLMTIIAIVYWLYSQYLSISYLITYFSSS